MRDKHDKKIEWFEKARLGIFIHWGLYSATEGYYNGKETCGIVDWIQSREKIPNWEYERFTKNLSADCFNADEIADLAKYAGAKYNVLPLSTMMVFNV